MKQSIQILLSLLIITALYCGSGDKVKSLIIKNFSGMSLMNRRFYNTDMRQASFKRANLTRADLSFSNFTKANFTGAILKQADFSGANLTHAVLRNADCTGAEFTNADMNGSDIAGAVFKDAIMRSVDFRGADFILDKDEKKDGDQKVKRVDFTGTDLYGAIINKRWEYLIKEQRAKNADFIVWID